MEPLVVFLRGLFELIRPYIRELQAFFTAIALSSSLKESKLQKDRADALQKRDDVEAYVDGLSSDDVRRLLDEQWSLPRMEGDKEKR